MREGRRRARLALEAGAALGIRGELGRKDLDRDVALQSLVSGSVDLAHASGADGGNDLVGTEFGSVGDGHGERRDFNRYFSPSTS